MESERDAFMKIWLIKEGEPLPCDENSRLMRMGMLAEYLAENGHQVVWWSSTYIHGKKKYYCTYPKVMSIRKNEDLVLLHSKISYKKNVSLSRIAYHEQLGRAFAKNLDKFEKPDIILCSYPIIQFANEAIKYGKKNHVPVILDVRDLWPDIFVRAFPKRWERIANVALIPLKLQAKSVFSQADVIISLTKRGLEWGLKKAGRKKNSLDRVIYIGYKPDEWKDQDEHKIAVKEWEKYGVTCDTWNICFFSTLSNSGLDLKTAIEATKRLARKYPRIRLVIGGDGDGAAKYKEIASNDSRIVFPGWLGNTQIHSLMELSKIGIYPLRNLPDLHDTFSNKLVGYLSSGLPVASSLSGFSKEYIEKYDIGLCYDENDVDSCYRVIEQFYLDDEMRKRKARNAYHRFCIDFHSEVVNKQFEDLMLEILGGG